MISASDTPVPFAVDAMDQLEQRVNEFFVNAKKNKPEWREEQMGVIKKVPNKSQIMYISLF